MPNDLQYVRVENQQYGIMESAVLNWEALSTTFLRGITPSAWQELHSHWPLSLLPPTATFVRTMPVCMCMSVTACSPKHETLPPNRAKSQRLKARQDTILGILGVLGSKTMLVSNSYGTHVIKWLMGGVFVLNASLWMLSPSLCQKSLSLKQAFVFC